MTPCRHLARTGAPPTAANLARAVRTHGRLGRRRRSLVVGGGNVASQFADAGLLDEVRVTVVPVVLGTGKPLFDRRVGGEPMRLIGVAPKPNGMVELAYELAERP
jgi:dihydrofolate reductase